MDFLSHRGPVEEVDDAAPTMTPGTKAALDDLAAALEGVALRTPGIAAPRAGRPAGDADEPGVLRAPDRRVTPPRRSPRAKTRATTPGSPGAPPSPSRDDVLAAILAKASASPLPPAETNKQRAVPYTKKTPGPGPGPGAVSASTPPPRRSPQLVVRHARENAASPRPASPRSPADAANDAPTRTTADPIGAAPSPAARAARRAALENDRALEEALIEEPTSAGLAPPRPRPRVETVKADLGGVHASPTRRRRSARETKPSDPTSFATFRAAKREEARRREGSPPPFDAFDLDALASSLDASELLLSPPPRREPRVRARDSSVSVGLLFSAEMELHAGPAHHLERPARHAAVVDKFRRAGLVKMCDLLAVREATDDELLTCHSSAHVDATARAFDPSPDAPSVQGEGDIYYTAHTNRCARLAAGGATVAALAVASGRCARAFATVRPPGHHADCGRATGFCFFNNAAVAARAALREPGVERVLVLDWDVHHGNGCQDILYDDPRVMYVSLHRYGEGFYPGTGAEDEIGAGAGAGYNVNVPWREKGLGDADYLAAFDLLIDPIASQFDPHLVVIAAGFDAAEGDPLGGMRVTERGYALMTKRLLRLANGRVVAALEGGYGLTSTADAAAATLEAMLGFEAAPLSLRRRPRRSTVELLTRLAGIHADRWRVLATPEHAAKMRAALDATKVVGVSGGGSAKGTRVGGAKTPGRDPRKTAQPNRAVVAPETPSRESRESRESRVSRDPEPEREGGGGDGEAKRSPSFLSG